MSYEGNVDDSGKKMVTGVGCVDRAKWEESA
jgi:hypothetical protein